MPKQTFYNLPEQKRQTIEQAALDEFAEYGFDASNMNRIVEKGKFAKGSFYQYFEDKKDLYFHLVDMLFHKKMEHIEPALLRFKENCLSDNLSEIFRLGLEFSERDPRLQRLGEDFSTRQRKFVNEFIEKYQPETMDYSLALLTSAKANGELRDDFNIPIASFFVSALINQTTFKLMGETDSKEQRSIVVDELLSFIERAVVKN